MNFRVFLGNIFFAQVAHMSLSPAAAAKIAGVSRSLISRSIKAGELRATLKNNTHHAIERADLDDWMSRRTERAAADLPVLAPAAEQVTRHPDAEALAKIEALQSELATMRERLARAEGEIAVGERWLSEIRGERDKAREEAQRAIADLLALHARTADAAAARSAGLDAAGSGSGEGIAPRGWLRRLIGL